MASFTDVFSVPIFFIILRETIEAGVIISVLLAFIANIDRNRGQPITADVIRGTQQAEQTEQAQQPSSTLNVPSQPATRTSSQSTRSALDSIVATHIPVDTRRLSRLVWIGTFSGLALSLAVGAVFLILWYTYAVDAWSQAEELWEGVFSLIASIMVAGTALAMLRGSRLYSKYQTMLSDKLVTMNTNTTGGNAAGLSESTLPDGNTSTVVANTNENSASTLPRASNTDTNTASADTEDADRTISRFSIAFFWVPFITVLREGLEGIIFIGGVSLGAPATSIPLATIVGIITGVVIGVIIHRSGSMMSLHWFFVISTYILLLLASGLLSRSSGYFEDYVWSRKVNLKSDDVGTGVFDPRRVVWHFDCCSPEDKNSIGWSIFNALLGWRNNATISTVTVYCLFWGLIVGVIGVMRLHERGLISCPNIKWYPKSRHTSTA